MDQEKAKKAAELVSKRSFLADMMKDFMVGLKKAGTEEDVTTSVFIYARWIPALVEKAAEELGEIDRQIREL